ncbi:unnamed protein product [Peronospora belbahrii]|uniref:Uncharacterized protein n=1 Tax=Peronospora belbahrii TaxID=622444 RepID=A0ABN8DAA6_9STRA|nr:unnamed protein product [Peronospora belbahrii]
MRHVLTDKLFTDIEEASARQVTLFIPAPRIAGAFDIQDILHVINREPQSATSNQELNLLCDLSAFAVTAFASRAPPGSRWAARLCPEWGRSSMLSPTAPTSAATLSTLLEFLRDLKDDVIYD